MWTCSTKFPAKAPCEFGAVPFVVIIGYHALGHCRIGLYDVMHMSCYQILYIYKKKLVTCSYRLRSHCAMMHPHVAKICSSQMLAASGGEWEIKAGGPVQGTRSGGPGTTCNHLGKMGEALVLIIVIKTWPIFHSRASFGTQGLRPQVST